MHLRIRAILARISPALEPAKPILEWVSEAECAIASAWTKSAHKRLMSIQRGIPPAPENFDHQIDQFYWWAASRNPQWVERGVYGALALTGGNLLELCCGDGFNARNFYSLKAQQVVACDFDAKIISIAKRKNAAPNVSFHIADIRTQMPAGQYDNIVWDAAIDYFTEPEIMNIMQSIKDRLSPGGILSGHTAIERADRQGAAQPSQIRIQTQRGSIAIPGALLRKRPGIRDGVSRTTQPLLLGIRFCHSIRGCVDKGLQEASRQPPRSFVTYR